MPETDILGDTLGNIMPSGMPNLLPANIITYIVVAVAVGAVLYIFLRWNHRADVYARDATGYMRKKRTEWVRLYTDKKGIKRFDMLMTRKTMLDQYRPYSGGRTMKFLLFQDSKGFLHDIRIAWDSFEDTANVKCVPTDAMAHQVGHLERLVQTYKKQGFWAQYGSMLVQAGTILILAFVIIYVMETSKDITGGAAALYDRACTAAQSAAPAVQQVVAK